MIVVLIFPRTAMQLVEAIEVKERFLKVQMVTTHEVIVAIEVLWQRMNRLGHEDP
jgi:hypothetical protein